MARHIEGSIPGFTAQSIAFAGEGDFCKAYTVNDEWMFRFAYNEEGSRSLEREAALLPRLAPTIKLAIPDVSYFGRQRENGLAFVAHRKIHGVELTRDRLLGLEPIEQERCARHLAEFLAELHSFSIAVARQCGVVECGYPFCRTEEGIMGGPAKAIYRRELERLLSYPAIDEETGRYCSELVDALIAEARQTDLTHVLAHGDLSSEHVMFDADARRITGVIDFSDVVITTPLLDFMYLYYAYGKEFLVGLLRHYYGGVREDVAARVHMLREWHAALRLLWVLDHGYEHRVPAMLREFQALREAPIGQYH